MTFFYRFCSNESLSRFWLNLDDHPILCAIYTKALVDEFQDTAHCSLSLFYPTFSIYSPFFSVLGDPEAARIYDLLLNVPTQWTKLFIEFITSWIACEYNGHSSPLATMDVSMGESLSAKRPLWPASFLGVSSGKRDFYERSMSIAQWTMRMFSVDA